MTKKIKQMASLLLIAAFAASCSSNDDPAPKTIAVTGLTLDQSTLTLTVAVLKR